MPQLQLTVDGNPIQQINSVTYLGVQLASDLTLMLYVPKQRSNYWYHRFYSARPTTLTQLYRSLVVVSVLPTLDYCSSISVGPLYLSIQNTVYICCYAEFILVSVHQLQKVSAGK